MTLKQLIHFELRLVELLLILIVFRLDLHCDKTFVMKIQLKSLKKNVEIFYIIVLIIQTVIQMIKMCRDL